MAEFQYTVTIRAESQQEADRVFIERIGPDEDLREYGVGDYIIDGDRADGEPLDPIEVG